MYIRLNSVQIQYARIASYVSVCVQFLLFLAQIRAKIHLCFCKRLLWGIISQNLLLKREEIVIVYFREVRGINLKIVSLTFPWLFQGQKVHLRLKSRVDSCATTGWRYWPKSLDFFCLVRPFQLVIWKLKKIQSRSLALLHTSSPNDSPKFIILVCQHFIMRGF